MFRTKIGVWDLLAAVVVVAVALLLLLSPLLFRRDGALLEITTPTGTAVYSLSEDRTVEVKSRGITISVVIRDGAAYVRESDCPDGVCVVSGKISHGGETVVCAPAGIRLLVKGGENDADFVAG